MTTKTRPVELSAYRLTGIAKSSGQCDCCARRITQRVFAVRHRVTGEELALGRRCAARATGYAVNAIERELLIAARVTEVARRRAIVGAAFPRIAAAWVEQEEYAAIARRDGREVASAVTRAPHYLLAYLGDTAAYEDAWWGGSGTGRYATWMDYLNAQI